MKIIKANRIAPDGMPRFAASHLDLFCLPMPHKKDARLMGLPLSIFKFQPFVNILVGD